MIGLAAFARKYRRYTASEIDWLFIVISEWDDSWRR